MVSLGVVLGGLVGYWVARLGLLGTKHLTIRLEIENGTLKSTTSPTPIRVKKLQAMKWHVEGEEHLGPGETLQIVFTNEESPLFEGHPKAQRENRKLKIKGRPKLTAREWPGFTYKYDVVHVVNGQPQRPPLEDPEIQIEHI
jgi:hypothetical protein